MISRKNRLGADSCRNYFSAVTVTSFRSENSKVSSIRTVSRIMEKNDWSRIIRAAGLLSYLGLIMIVTIGLGYFIGSFFDGLLSSEPWLSLLGLIIGVGGGFYGVYQTITGVMGDE